MSKHIGESQLATCMVGAANTAGKTVTAFKKCCFNAVLPLKNNENPWFEVAYLFFPYWKDHVKL